MARKFQDMAAKGPKYTDRDGKERNRFQPLGVLVTEDDGRQWGTLRLLGLEVQFSIFDQKDRDNGGSQEQGRSSPPAQRSPDPVSRSQPLDDDIPF